MLSSSRYKRNDKWNAQIQYQGKKVVCSIHETHASSISVPILWRSKLLELTMWLLLCIMPHEPLRTLITPKRRSRKWTKRVWIRCPFCSQGRCTTRERGVWSDPFLYSIEIPRAGRHRNPIKPAVPRI